MENENKINKANETIKTIDEVLKNLEDESIHEQVEKITPIKEWLVTYVGEKYKPENMNVDVNMVVNALAEEFPEFLRVVSEENFFRGYNQALFDMQTRIKMKKPDAKTNECKCEKPCEKCKPNKKKKK